MATCSLTTIRSVKTVLDVVPADLALAEDRASALVIMVAAADMVALTVLVADMVEDMVKIWRRI
jgi:hypothetical protein